MRADKNSSPAMHNQLADAWVGYISNYLDNITLFNLSAVNKNFNAMLKKELLKRSPIPKITLDVSNGSTVYYLLAGNLFVWKNDNNTLQQITFPNKNSKIKNFFSSIFNKTSKNQEQIKIKEIFTKYGSVFAITTEGEVYAWGKNRAGQLGIGNKEDQVEPKKIKFPKNEKITHVDIVTGCYGDLSKVKNMNAFNITAVFRTEHNEVYKTGVLIGTKPKCKGRWCETIDEWEQRTTQVYNSLKNKKWFLEGKELRNVVSVVAVSYPRGEQINFPSEEKILPDVFGEKGIQLMIIAESQGRYKIYGKVCQFNTNKMISPEFYELTDDLIIDFDSVVDQVIEERKQKLMRTVG